MQKGIDKMNKFSIQSLQQHWLRWLVNGVAVFLCLRTGWMISLAPTLPGWALFTDSPELRNIILFTGKSGLIFLVLSLACTPLARLLGWSAALQVRKALGLWGFGFAAFHSLFFLQGKQLFTNLKSEPALWRALHDMVQMVRYGSKVPYAEAGVYALFLLSLLAITSNRLAMRQLGKNWKRLHRIVYLAVPVAVYHYWWRTIEPFPVPPPPDSWQVFLFALVVGLLLMVRLPPIHRRLAKMLTRTRRREIRAAPQPVSMELRKPVNGRPPRHHMTNGATQDAAEKQERIKEQV